MKFRQDMFTSMFAIDRATIHQTVEPSSLSLELSNLHTSRQFPHLLYPTYQRDIREGWLIGTLKIRERVNRLYQHNMFLIFNVSPKGGKRDMNVKYQLLVIHRTSIDALMRRCISLSLISFAEPRVSILYPSYKEWSSGVDLNASSSPTYIGGFVMSSSQFVKSKIYNPAR